MLNNIYDPHEAASQKFRRFVKYLTYFWVFRLALLAGGGIFSSFFELFMTKTGNDHFVKVQDVPSISWKRVVADDFRPLLKAMKKGGEPIIFHNVPVVETNSLLQSVLTNQLPISKMTVKLSDSPLFEHHDVDRAWSGEPEIPGASHLIMNMVDYLSIPGSSREYMQFLHSMRSKVMRDLGNPIKADRFQGKKQRGFTTGIKRFDTAPQHVEGEGSLDQCATGDVDTAACRSEEMKRYMYSTFPDISPLVPALTPGLSQFLSILPHHLFPQQCLWLSDEQVTAALHYDMEDNMLLQVAGTKTVTIASPEVVLRAHSFPSSHPLWRQTPLSNELTSATRLRRFLTNSSIIREVSNEKESLDCVSLIQQEIQLAAREQRSPQAPAICKATTLGSIESLPTKKTELTASNEYSMNYIRMWEVKLRAGDMVYIPAGYYHTVRADADSVSINSWFTSHISSLFDQLMEVPFVFGPRERFTTKLCKLSAVVPHVLQKANISIAQFMTITSHRYDAVFLNLIRDVTNTECTLEKTCSILCPRQKGSWIQFSDIPPNEQKVIDDVSEHFNHIRSATYTADASDVEATDIHRSVETLLVVGFIEYLEEILNIIIASAQDQLGCKPWEIFKIFFDCVIRRLTD